jgi:hypothetical protein
MKMGFFAWIMVGGAVLLALVILLVILYALYSKKVTAALPDGTVKTTLERADVLADKGVAASALQTLVMLFSERGNTEKVQLLGTLWVDIWAWKPPAEIVVADTSATDIATLAAQIKAQAAEIAAIKQTGA